MYQYKAHCVSAYDGDTIRADIDLGFGIWMKDQVIRLYGINAPEMRGDDKVAGKASRDYLRGLILHRDIVIKTHKDKKGKYGRWIGEILCAEPDETITNVNKMMVTKGHAVEKEY